MSKFTALKVAHYTGDMDVDNWNKEKWFDEFNENQVYSPCRNREKLIFADRRFEFHPRKCVLFCLLFVTFVR